MRRSGHPSRPRAITCCFFASLKTLLISTKAICLTPKSTSRASFSLAGFQVTIIGRFWVTAGAWNKSRSIQLTLTERKFPLNVEGAQEVNVALSETVSNEEWKEYNMT